MAGLTLRDIGPSGQILLLGAHCDDIEIGCGATLVDLVQRWPNLDFHVIIFCSDDRREMEARQSLAILLGDKTQVSINFAGFRDGFLPYQATDTKEYLHREVSALDPGLVFTHSRNDLHQDHRFIAEITHQALRSGLILEMEIPKYDGDMGRPNVYFPVSQRAAEHKISTLMQCYPSQSGKHWFTEESFAAIMRLRGLECKSENRLAEAFYASKIIVA